jgi:DNA polymerase-3 subunit alpha
MIWLNARTHFSLGESVVKIDELVDAAKEQGVHAIGLMDTMNVSGMIDFCKRCKEGGIKPIVGVRLRVVDDPLYRKPGLGEPKKDNYEYYPNVYIRNHDGWLSVLRLLSKGLSEDYFYYKPRIGLDDLLEELERGGLIVTSGDFNGVFTHPSAAKIWTAIEAAAGELACGEVVPLNTPFWDRYNFEVIKHTKSHAVTWPILYLTGEEAEARDVASAIISNHKITDRFRHIPHTRCHHPVDASQLRSHKEGTYGRLGIKPTVEYEIEPRIEFSWSKLPVTLPSIATGETEFDMLVRLCKKGWKERFSQEILGHKPGPEELPKYQERLKYELGVIRKMGFERYFLVVADVVNWAKWNGILVGPGRGSVGGSLVAYLTRITDVDPIRFNLLFERFINPERLDLPDADLDFQSSRREEVIQYLVDKYGRDMVAGISNFSTMASASALRDVGRVYNIDLREMEITKLVPKEHGKPYELERAADEVPQIDNFRVKHPAIWKTATRLEGVMRSFGRHAAGVVVAGEPLSNRAVVETHRGEPVVNWDKVFVEDLGLVKMDVLGLSTLDVIGLALKYIEQRHRITIDMTTLPLDDPKTLDSFAEGQTVGVFQFESSGMRTLLKDLGMGGKLTFEDLAAATSLYRPGPKDSGLLDDYVAIRQGLKRPYYEHPNMIPALETTGGVMVYQEQVMQITRDLCGFSAAEADAARKAMGKKDKDKMEALRAKFVAGAQSHSGMESRPANGLFDKIMNFAAYAFNRSHAVEYSVISYWTMWLKVNYPAEFYAAGLTILGDDKLEGLVRDARKREIEVMPPRINTSTQRFEIIDGLKERSEKLPNAVLIAPFSRVKGISENTAQSILEARNKAGKFLSRKHLEGIVNRTKVNVRHRDALDKVGAFHGIEPGSLPPLHPDRRKDQMALMPGLIIDMVKADRAIVTGEAIKNILISEVVRPVQSCKGCSLSGGVHPMPRLGAKAKFMVVTDCPNYSEEAENKMFSGKASGFLREALNSAELKAADAYFTSLVKSPKSGKLLSNEQINGCAGYLMKEIEILKPPVILALGSSTVNYLVPGLKGGVQEHTGRVHYNPKLDANIVIGFNPAMIAFDSSKQTALNEILATVAELVS